MSTAVLEEIIEKLKLLSEAEQQKLTEVIEQLKRMKTEAERRAFIRSLKGKYKNSLSSIDEFCAKTEKIEMEDRGERKCQLQF